VVFVKWNLRCGILPHWIEAGFLPSASRKRLKGFTRCLGGTATQKGGVMVYEVSVPIDQEYRLPRVASFF